jgi:hypothetical protein
LSVMAYHSFSGEVEASNTPTIRRLIPLGRHQLPHLAQARADQLLNGRVRICVRTKWILNNYLGAYFSAESRIF